MMKYLLTSLAAIFLANTLNAQLVVDSPEYEQAKKNGTLGNQLVIPNPINHPLPAGFVGKKKPVQSGTEKANSCNCYVEPDATYLLALAPNDDGSSALIQIPFDFCLYGNTYNAIYINNNGNLTFTNPMGTYSASAFPSNGDGIVAPFWGDVDTRDGNGEVVYKINPTSVYINWHNVGYYSQQGDLLNNFQLIITDGSDPVIQGGNVAFCYGDMQWTTGGASQGVGGFGGVPATAGANAGNGTDYFLVSRFDHPGNDFDGALGNPDGISWLDYKSFAFDACSVGNVPPIPDGVSSCDTFKICAVGDTADISINFLSPETNQSTSITYSLGGLSDYQEIANISGNTAQLILRLFGSAADAGYHTVSVTATDNYLPINGVTTLSFTVFIDTSTSSTLNPQLTTAPYIGCDTVPLAVSGGPYDTYLWDDFTNEQTSGVSQSGDYGVTVSLNGCYKRVHEYITIVHPTPLNMQGTFTFCPPATTTTVWVPDSTAFSTITWGLADPNLDSMFINTLGAGTYTIHAMDAAGFCTTDTTFIIQTQQPLVLQPDTSTCSGSFTFTLNTGGTPTGTWTVIGNPPNPPVFANDNLNTTVTFPANGTYQLVYTTDGLCVDKDTVAITAGSPPVYNSVGSYFYCPDMNSTTISFPDSTSIGDISWGLADPGRDSMFINSLTNGTYTVTLTSLYSGCTVDSTFTITSQPALNFEPDISVCSNQHTFVNNTGGSGTGVWTVAPGAPGTATFSSTTVLNPTVTFDNYGAYQLIYTETNCGEDDTVSIYYAPQPQFHMQSTYHQCPNALAPVSVSSTGISSITWSAGTQYNDQYTVDLAAGTYTAHIVSTYGCTNDTTFTITTQPKIILDAPAIVCNDSLQFYTNQGVANGTWSVFDSPGNFTTTGDNLNPLFVVDAYGTYNIVYSEPVCNDADTIQISFEKYMYVDLINNTEICQGQTIELVANNGVPEFTTSLVWSTGSTSNSITVSSPGYYYVTATGNCGSYSDSVQISIAYCDFEVPNVFTPDGDNQNDQWFIITSSDIFASYRCFIVNRWGNVVHETNDWMDKWDGKDQSGNDLPDGVYFYNIQFTDLGGEEKGKQGFVEIFRK